jgi:indolepyruvate ferredoxin oxidoreductase beta subunit
MASAQRTLVITSTSRALTTQERMQLGDGRAESGELLEIVRGFTRAHHAFDMNAVAKEAGTVVSAVMLGAIAGSGVFPFTRDDYENVVREGGGTSAQASLKGFAKGFELCRGGQVGAPGGGDAHDGAGDIVALGRQRLIDYQGPAYAALYEQRLARVREVDSPSSAITRETARWLALWMAFDDIVRVADLKSRASRWQRVKGEVKAADADLLRVWDHFKPGAPEFAALLPPRLAQRVLAWDRKRATPWALPLKVGTHSVFGMLALRTLASLKWLRTKGSRYADEQRMIERWLDAVVQGARRDAQLGLEIARCGRLIKGYGTTNERGKANLLHALEHLAPLPDAHAAARAIAQAREAALADEAGKAFDATLAGHGAPPRPVKEQPVRFVPPRARTARVETTIPKQSI